MKDFGDLGGGRVGGINASGQVVGSTNTWGNLHAFLYSGES